MTQFAVVAARRPRPPIGLFAAGSGVALLIALPLLFLLLQAFQVGWTELSALLFRRLTLTLLWNTISLTAVVTLTCAVAGTGAAWSIERTEFPGRRVLGTLLVVPLAIPDFVVAFGWTSVAPPVHGFWGASLVMTLGLYPLVYVPVAASLRSADPAQEESARSLGVGPLCTFWKVTLRQSRAALLGGCLLVALALLAEYGAFEMLRYQTFTTTIFTEFEVGFNPPAACALALVLVALGLLIVGGETLIPDRGRTARSASLGSGTRVRRHLGRAMLPTVATLALLPVLALGVPIGVIGYWLVRGGPSTLPATTSVLGAAMNTGCYSGLAAAMTTLLAIPVALLSVRHRSVSTRVIERSTYLIQGLPGLVIALALVYFSIHYVALLYQSSALLILAYAMLFFPLALVAVRASVLRAPVGLEEVARSLGRHPLLVQMRVTLPLIAPGLAAAFCLVFLLGVTELTTTLLLVPTGAQTLSTQFWAFTQNVSYAAAAPYAAAMIGIAVVPSYLLQRWFNRAARTAPVIP